MQDVNDMMQHITDVWAGVKQLLTMPLTSSTGVSMPAFQAQLTDTNYV